MKQPKSTVRKKSNFDNDYLRNQKKKRCWLFRCLYFRVQLKKLLNTQKKKKKKKEKKKKKTLAPKKHQNSCISDSCF